MQFKKSDWKLIARDNQKDKGRFNGLSVYLHIPTGKYALRDMSGDYPHETDDGVLWIGKLIDYDRAIISVTSERDKKQYTALLTSEFAHRLTLESILEVDESPTIRRLRAKGYAVVIFSPAELGKINPSLVEDSLVKMGNEIVDNITEQEEYKHCQSCADLCIPKDNPNDVCDECQEQFLREES
jgi:hypothetical protein